MKINLFKHVKKFLPLLGIVLLILYIYFNLDPNKIRDAFLSINPLYILLALTLTPLRILLRNKSWHLIQQEQKIYVTFWESMKIFLIGYFYGSFTPGYLGQLMRIPYLKEKTGQKYGKLFINSTIETLVHTTSIYLMILIGALLVISEYPDLLYFIIAWIIIFISIILFFVNRQRGEKVFFTLIKFFIPKKFREDFNSFVGTFYNDFPRVKKLILPFILGLFTWIIIFTQEYVFVIALDLAIPYHYFILLFPVANVIGFIPITFAGIGTREITAITLFTAVLPAVQGFENEILVVALMGFLVTDVMTGLIGFFVSLTETKYKPSKKA